MSAPKVTCQYCGEEAQLVGGDKIYPHRPDLASLKFWECEPCEAFVGTHKPGSWRYVKGRKIMHEGTEPLGRLAKADLRMAKRTAHLVFDPLWQSGLMTRVQAYAWLAARMGMPIDDMHIGNLDVHQCHQVVSLCKEQKMLRTHADTAPST